MLHGRNNRSARPQKHNKMFPWRNSSFGSFQSGVAWWRGLIVLSGIAILAVVAIPSYQNYTLPSQVIEGLAIADGVKTWVTEAYFKTGAWPKELSAEELRQLRPTRYVQAVYVDRGTIFIRYGNAANEKLADRRLALRPSINAVGDVLWACGLHKVDGFDPPTGAAAPGDTTVPVRMLPSSCKE